MYARQRVRRSASSERWRRSVGIRPANKRLERVAATLVMFAASTGRVDEAFRSWRISTFPLLRHREEHGRLARASALGVSPCARRSAGADRRSRRAGGRIDVRKVRAAACAPSSVTVPEICRASRSDPSATVDTPRRSCARGRGHARGDRSDSPKSRTHHRPAFATRPSRRCSRRKAAERVQRQAQGARRCHSAAAFYFVLLEDLTVRR